MIRYGTYEDYVDIGLSIEQLTKMLNETAEDRNQSIKHMTEAKIHSIKGRETSEISLRFGKVYYNSNTEAEMWIL